MEPSASQSARPARGAPRPVSYSPAILMRPTLNGFLSSAMRHRVLAGLLLAGLLVRVAILWNTADLGPRISDERHYVELAGSLLNGRGFAWATGAPTSLRPPLYPALVACVWRVAGDGNLQAVRMVQFGLALLTALLVYEIGRRAFTRRAGLIAAAVTWLYPSLIFMNVTILGETLFTLLLVAFTLLAVLLVQRPAAGTAVACGLALGLGALTRSVLWPVPLVLCPLVAVLVGGSFRRRAGMAALVLAGYAVVVSPWAVRNTRLQGVVTVVDTMGGMNLRMGNYEHTPEDRIWDAVSLTGEKNWVYALTQEPPGSHPVGRDLTEGMKDKWAQGKAFEYMRAHPATTIRRAAIKFSDFWGLERSFIAGVQQGLYAPPAWFAVLASVLILSTCAVVSLSGAAGLWLAHPDWRTHVVLLLPVMVLTGVHTIVFGHPRYHLPLVPILALYGAALWQAGPHRAWHAPRVRALGAAASVLVLLGAWARQILVVDGEHIRSLLTDLWP